MTGARPLPAVGERLDEAPLAPFAPSDLRAYADVSGDDNPLHLDAAVSAQAGFAAPLVHGMLLFAAFEPALTAWRADLRIARLGGKFVQPLLIGQDARVGGRVVRQTEGGVLLRMIVQGPNRVPSILAEALLVSREIAA